MSDDANDTSPDPSDSEDLSNSENAAEIEHPLPTQADLDAPTAGSGLFDQSVLVVSQKANLVQLNTEYSVYDSDGTQIGTIRQVGQSKLMKAARLISSLDRLMALRLELVDMSGAVQLTITRQKRLAKSLLWQLHIADGSGNRVGTIREGGIWENSKGKKRGEVVRPRFMLERTADADAEPGDERPVIGVVQVEDWKAWNFTILDLDGAEVACITKTWAGLAKTVLTTADNYVLQIHRPLSDPLRSLVVASAVAADLALKQGSNSG